MTGGAKEPTVRDLVVAPGVERLLVMELLRRESAASVVRVPVRGTLTGPASPLSGQALELYPRPRQYSSAVPTMAKDSSKGTAGENKKP